MTNHEVLAFFFLKCCFAVHWVSEIRLLLIRIIILERYNFDLFESVSYG